MIAVAGEALIDLIIDPAGGTAARPGGGPFNAARAMARIGQPVTFLGRVSGDRFGSQLRAALDADGVSLAIGEPAVQPSTLAVVHVGTGGVPEYSFYLSGTSAFQLDPAVTQAAIPGGELTALHLGGLALAVEPAASTLEHLAETADDSTLVMVDPNCRPRAITDRQRYTSRLSRILRRADVVKASVEDLAYLGVADPRALGNGNTLVMITDGPGPVRGFGAGAGITVDVPAEPVADTVGAGDAFGGAFLAWWAGHGLGRGALTDAGPVGDAMAAAAQAAALTCRRPGAEPPWAAELASYPLWGWLARGSTSPG